MLLAEIDFDQSLQNTIDDVMEFIPKLLAAVVILIIGVFIAKIIQKVAVTVLKKVKFDDLVDKAGIGSHVEAAGYPDSGVLLAKLLYYAIVLMALQLAINVFGESALQDAIQALIALLPKIFIAAVIVVLTGAIANAVKTMIQPMLQTVGPKELVTNVAVGAIWVVGVFAALDQIGVAQDIIDTLFQAIVGALTFILVIKFGVGGIWAARDRFWPAVYDKLGATTDAPSSTGNTPPPSDTPPQG